MKNLLTCGLTLAFAMVGSVSIVSAAGSPESFSNDYRDLNSVEISADMMDVEIAATSGNTVTVRVNNIPRGVSVSDRVRRGGVALHVQGRTSWLDRDAARARITVGVPTGITLDITTSSGSIAVAGVRDARPCAARVDPYPSINSEVRSPSAPHRVGSLPAPSSERSPSKVLRARSLSRIAGESSPPRRRRERSRENASSSPLMQRSRAPADRSVSISPTGWTISVTTSPPPPADSSSVTSRSPGAITSPAGPGASS
jgi:hypothetical protein